MMNFVAMFLVVTSLVSAGVWSPSPDQQNQKKQREEVIVKNGHRVVVVEYEHQQGHNPNTKVSISPEQDGRRRASAGVSSNEVSAPSRVTRALDNAMENIKEAAASIAMGRGQDQGQGLSQLDEQRHRHSSANELICDAYGKCKHKIASALKTKKEILKGAAHEAEETAHTVIDTKKDIMKGTAHEVKETAHKVGKAVEDAYDAVSDKAEEVGERAQETAYKAKDTVEDAYGRAKDTVEDVYERAKETVSDTTHEVGERAKESVDKAMDTAKLAKEMGKTLSGDVQRNVSNLKNAPEQVKEKAREAVEDAAEHVAQTAHRAKHTAESAAHKVKTVGEDAKDVSVNWLRRILNIGKGTLHNMLRAVGSVFGLLERSLTGLSLLGVATAYGMSMWITFGSNYVLSRVLSPHQFGMVQSKIYKVYFPAMASTVGLAMLGHLLSHRKVLTGMNADAIQNFNLMLAELMVLFNMLYLEPRATKAMFDRLKLEKEEGRGREHVNAETSTEAERQPVPAEPSTAAPSEVPERREPQALRPQVDRLNETHQRLKKLNSYSAILNIWSLMALSWHLVYLAKRLDISCS